MRIKLILQYKPFCGSGSENLLPTSLDFKPRPSSASLKTVPVLWTGSPGTWPRYQHLGEKIPQSRFQVTNSKTENGKMYNWIKTLLNFPFTNAFNVYFLSLLLPNLFLFREPFWPSEHWIHSRITMLSEQVFHHPFWARNPGPGPNNSS
jgi:hypothetical protein